MEWGGCAWFTCRHVRSISMQGWIWSSHCGRDNLHKGCRKAITAWHDISIASRSYHMSHHGSCGRDNLHKGCREAITTRHGISHHIISHHITTTPHPLSPTMWVCVCDCRYTSHHSSSHHIHIMCLSWMARQIYLRVVAKPSHHGMSISQHIT